MIEGVDQTITKTATITQDSGCEDVSKYLSLSHPSLSLSLSVAPPFCFSYTTLPRGLSAINHCFNVLYPLRHKSSVL